jgi:hypothetical protein
MEGATWYKLMNKKYRLLLSLYGTVGYLLASGFSALFDEKLYYLVRTETGKEPMLKLPEYPWGWKVFLLGVPIFLLVYLFPQIARRMMGKGTVSSLRYGLGLFISYFAVTAVSFINFALNAPLGFEFLGLGLILFAVEWLEGYEMDFSFVQNSEIADQARIKRIEFLHKRWFSAISAFITIGIALLVTGAMRFTEIWQQQLGMKAAELLTRNIAIVVAYGGLGLIIGPIRQVYRILTTIEAELDGIRK